MTDEPIRPRIEQMRTHERPHVLLVTDDPSLSSFLAEGLPLGGFWISVIASGLQALEVFRLRQFDLVVLDVGLQSFDAEEFLLRLRGQSDRDRAATARTQAPVVLIHPGPAHIPHSRAQSLGIEAELAPPLEIDEVVRALHQVFLAWRHDHPTSPLADSASARDF